MSTVRQPEEIAAELLSETEGMISLLQQVKIDLKAMARPNTRRKLHACQPHRPSSMSENPSSVSDSRLKSFHELRLTIEMSRRHLDTIFTRLLEETQAAEDDHEQKSNGQGQSVAPMGLDNERQAQEYTALDEPDVSRKASSSKLKTKAGNTEKKEIHMLLRNKKSANRSDIALDAPAIQGRQHESNSAAANAKANETLNHPVSKELNVSDLIISTKRTGTAVPSEPDTLRYKCTKEELGVNMVSTISKARLALQDKSVDERGYLILTTSLSWNHSELDQMLQSTTFPKGEYSKGLLLQQAGNECYYVYRNDRAKLDLRLPAFESLESGTKPEQTLQASIDSLRDGQRHVAYVVGPHANTTQAGQDLASILNPGPVTSQRPNLPGINSPYWYLSHESGTPATMHMEDGLAGSANMLLAGAEKHWLVIHRSSIGDLERCIREEFESSNCSQFLRHHHIFLSPRWLTKRGIKFDMPYQRPGEIMITLPGMTYHEVLNAGANFAVAINYEFPDTPSAPSDYTWCTRGRNRCGTNAIRLEDFQIPVEAIDENKSSARCEETTVELSDDESYQPPTFLRLPDQLPDDPRDVSRLIELAIDQGAAPEWFGCGHDTHKLKLKLQQFQPGNWLHDDIFMKLLNLIALPRGLCVKDSLNLDINSVSAPDIMADLPPGITGIVLPFHVNSTQQSSSKDRNHWVLAVFDIFTNTFTSWGIERDAARHWAEALGSIECQDRHDLPPCSNVQPYPENPDGASCALCCCFALETYLDTAPHQLSSSTMRSHYLRKLLEGYNMLTIQHRMIGNTAIGVRIAADSCVDDEDINGADVVDTSDSINTSLADPAQCKRAWRDKSLPNNERKLRLIQLILQCQTRHFQPRSDVTAPSSSVIAFKADGPRTIFALMEQIEDTSGMYLEMLHQRLLLLKLHLMFQSELNILNVRRSKARLMRRRAKAGEPLDPLPPGTGKKAENVVIDSIIKTIPGNDTKSQRTWRAKLKHNLGIGEVYHILTSSLGIGILAAIPYEEAPPVDLQNVVPDVPTLKQTISPSEYQKLPSLEREFFVKWFTQLNSEVKGWSCVDFEHLYVDETYWNDLRQLQAQVLKPSFQTMGLDKSKRRKL